MKIRTMKGVSFVTDEKNRKKAVMIDFKTLHDYSSEVEELLDVIIAESRREEESVPFKEVKRHLKKIGKL